jgi:hypothetical protein
MTEFEQKQLELINNGGSPSPPMVAAIGGLKGVTQ